jgi:hypothetical protein
VSVNETLVEAKMCTFTLESTHFIFNKCPIYTHDGASAKFSTNSQETDYSVVYFKYENIKNVTFENILVKRKTNVAKSFQDFPAGRADRKLWVLRKMFSTFINGTYFLTKHKFPVV